ncbi:hypothetical protein [Candidatus Nitrospira salsa]
MKNPLLVFVIDPIRLSMCSEIFTEHHAPVRIIDLFDDGVEISADKNEGNE